MTEAGFASWSCRLPAHRLAKWVLASASEMRAASMTRILETQLQIRCGQSTLSEGLRSVFGANLDPILKDFEVAKSMQHLSLLSLSFLWFLNELWLIFAGKN